jgi:hypothetical protein
VEMLTCGRSCRKKRSRRRDRVGDAEEGSDRSVEGAHDVRIEVNEKPEKARNEPVPSTFPTRLARRPGRLPALVRAGPAKGAVATGVEHTPGSDNLEATRSDDPGSLLRARPWSPVK